MHEQLTERLDEENLLGLDLNVRGLSLSSTKRLVDHDARLRAHTHQCHLTFQGVSRERHHQALKDFMSKAGFKTQHRHSDACRIFYFARIMHAKTSKRATP